MFGQILFKAFVSSVTVLIFPYAVDWVVQGFLALSAYIAHSTNWHSFQMAEFVPNPILHRIEQIFLIAIMGLHKTKLLIDLLIDCLIHFIRRVKELIGRK